MTCTYCPFAFTYESEDIQGLGCLPSPYDIIQMKRKSGHNWACHSNESKVCSGFVEFIKGNPSSDECKDIDMSTGGLISYETWYHEGEKPALEQANRRET